MDSEVIKVPVLSLHSYLNSNRLGQLVPVSVDGAKLFLSLVARHKEQPGVEQTG